ncbi:hypothetical protein CerSpe_272690 [Prunus speciosa]
MTVFSHRRAVCITAVVELENKRKERAQLAYERKKQLNKLRVKAEKKPRYENVVED